MIFKIYVHLVYMIVYFISVVWHTFKHDIIMHRSSYITESLFKLYNAIYINIVVYYIYKYNKNDIGI